MWALFGGASLGDEVARRGPRRYFDLRAAAWNEHGLIPPAILGPFLLPIVEVDP